MKKIYITPSIEVVDYSTETMMAASGVSSNNGIGFGGVDEDGSIVPSSNDRRDSWGNLWDRTN